MAPATWQIMSRLRGLLRECRYIGFNQGKRMLTTYTSYIQISADLPRSIERVGDQPLVARETEYYQENISNIKSVDEFMADSRIYNYALKAHGLEDMSYAKAFIRKVLTEGIETDSSFANQLADKRYSALVETFNFFRNGESTTVFTKAQQGTVDKYLRQTLEENAGNDNEGVRLALYFQRKASEITEPYQILADTALATVVRTALSLPDQFALTDIDKQAELFTNSIDFTDFQDPEKLETFLQRFTSLWELSNPTSVNTASVLLGGSSGFGISGDLLLSLNNLKLGG